MKIPEYIVLEIRTYIEDMKSQHNIQNKIVREDVFDILQAQCTVLYYDLDDSIEGCHIFKPVNGKLQQFVFINTNKNIQEQVWTAAHELGHVWIVDRHIADIYGEDCVKQFSAEALVGRFAAEFLMPIDTFQDEVAKKLFQFNYNDTIMSENMLMELIAHLMNYFCTPYKSIVRRFIELDYVDKSDEPQYMEYEQSEILKRVIEENQYWRLGKRRSSFSIENFAKDLQQAEDLELLDIRKINKIRNLLHIEKQPTGGEKLEFKGISEKPNDKSGN